MLYDLIGHEVRVHCLLIDYKQKHSQELTFARQHCQRLGVLFTTLTLPQLRGSVLTDGSGGVVVPGRNSIFLSHAVNLAVEAKAEAVTIGCNASDASMFPDCRQEFIGSYNAVLKASEIPVEVCAPYLHRTKSWIAGLGQEMGVKFYETWSCYRGGIQPCGECSACLNRQEAMR
jgi:7-cyano-7-deazaguanine synthase